MEKMRKEEEMRKEKRIMGVMWSVIGMFWVVMGFAFPVAGAPSVTITSPSDGALYPTQTVQKVEGTYEGQVVGVFLYDTTETETVLLASAVPAGGSFCLEWDTADVSLGQRTLTVVAQDCGDDSAYDAVQVWVFRLDLATSKTAILAGAKNDSVHQTTITASVTPSSISGTVMFSVESTTGGKDHAPDLSQTSVSLCSGQAQTTLTSSDVIEIITVTATFLGADESIEIISSGPDGEEWSFDPDVLEQEDDISEVAVALNFSGQPVVGHSLTFVVDGVILTDGTYVTENLEQYAEFDSPSTVTTDSSGQASAVLRAGENISNCVIVFVRVEDNNVWYWE